VLIRADGYYVTSTKSENFIKNFIRKKNTLIFKALQANIDMSQFRPKQLKIDLPQNHFIFLYFGRIIDWKGLDILLEAFEKVNQKFTDSTLLVIGDGDFKKECLKLVEDKKINNIIFEQPINDEDNEAKVGVYQVCDVFILPSTIIKNQSEGWGLTVGEAMSLGKPVIVTDAVGCCADLVENGTNGFVVKHGSATDLECAMLKAIEAKENLHVMGRKSRKYFEERVSHKKMAAALNEAISKV
jgi:glycosyltransferase involved in cell wall biosynthesis